MQRTQRTFAAVALVAIILLGLVPPAPSRASHGTDLAYAAPSGWTATILGTGPAGGNDNCPTSGGCDANDATGRRVDDHCGSQIVATGRGTHNYCSSGLAYTRTSGVTEFDLSSFRVVGAMCETGSGSSCGGASLDIVALVITTRENGVCSLNEVHYHSQAASGSIDTGELNFSGGAVTITDNATDVTGLCFHYEVASMNTVQWQTIATFEVYSDSYEIPSEFEEYVYDLRLDHPPFARVITWAWLKTWQGTWSVEDSDETLLDGGIGTHTEHTRESTTIQCFPVCGADTYRIDIHEDGHEAVYYEISSSVNGQVILDAGHAFIAFIEGCYNVTLNGCDDATYDAAADALSVSFTLVPEGGSVDPDRHYDGTVTIGRWDRASGADCGFVGSTVTTAVLGLGAHAPQVITSWDETGGYFDASGNQLVLLVWTSVVDDTSSCATVGIPMTGGDVGSVNPPVPGTGPAYNAPCADLASCIGREVRNAFESVLGSARDVWSDAIDVAHDAMLEKLPFAYVVLAFDGIGEQLSRASAEVEASDDCEGVTLNVPLGISGISPTATTMPMVVLTCEQLEPFMGTDWYQAVRTAMDPALWLLYAWSQVRALQPKASLNG